MRHVSNSNTFHIKDLLKIIILGLWLTLLLVKQPRNEELVRDKLKSVPLLAGTLFKANKLTIKTVHYLSPRHASMENGR